MSLVRIALVFGGCAALVLDAQTTVPTVSRIIPAQTLAPGGQSVSVDLARCFTIAGVVGQVVQFDTVLGKFNVELRADAAPQHAANFLGYVQRGQYAASFLHRSAALDGGPISIVQGGGYYVTPDGVAAVSVPGSVPLEYNLPNERGALAAARTGDINSATSQWYINVRDNTELLGPANGGGYTVFGRVLGSGMSVVDAVAALPRVNAGFPFTELPVRDYVGGNVQTPNLVMVNSIMPVSLYPGTSGASVLGFAAQSSVPDVVAASVSGSTLTLAPGSAGSATVTVRATDTNGGAVEIRFNVDVSTAAPAITTPPRSQTVATGSTFVLTAAAAGAMTYQWQRDGTDVLGATDATLMVSDADAGDAGVYRFVARNFSGTATSAPATIDVVTVPPADAGRLVNLSIRSEAGTSDQTLIVGFAVDGSGTSGNVPLLLRGMGPSLTKYGVTEVLADPVAALYTNTEFLASNDDWGGDPRIEARARQAAAFEFISTESLDAALAVEPAIGGYTMQITGKGSAGGTALAEIYDATPTITSGTPRLVNISARTQVGTGERILIAGFAIAGGTSKTVLLRATGPALAGFGVSGTLADPVLSVYPMGSGEPVAENGDWGGDPYAVVGGARVGAFPIVNGASTDAVLLVTLPPGNYTAQVKGADNGTGVALVEVYDVP